MAINTHERFKGLLGLAVHDCLSVGSAYRLYIVKNRFSEKSEYRYEVLENFWRSVLDV